MAPSGDLHLSAQGFEELLRHDVRREYSVVGELGVSVLIDRGGPMIGLRVPKPGGETSPEACPRQSPHPRVVAGGERCHMADPASSSPGSLYRPQGLLTQGGTSERGWGCLRHPTHRRFRAMSAAFADGG